MKVPWSYELKRIAPKHAHKFWHPEMLAGICGTPARTHRNLQHGRALKMAPGRKRKPGKRYPCGKRTRQELEKDAMSVAILRV